MAKYGFYYNQKSCSGCHTCQIACKDKNDLDVGPLFRRVRTFETGDYPNPGYYHFSSTCNHCENPACTRACPTGAMYKNEDGIVLHNDDQCVGCRACVMACPYDVPQYIDELRIVQKCNMCVDYIEQGQNPVCVDACTQCVLEWGPLDDLKAAHPDAVQDLPILPDSSLTQPSMLVSPRDCALDEDYEEMAI